MVLVRCGCFWGFILVRLLHLGFGGLGVWWFGGLVICVLGWGLVGFCLCVVGGLWAWVCGGCVCCVQVVSAVFGFGFRWCVGVLVRGFCFVWFVRFVFCFWVCVLGCMPGRGRRFGWWLLCSGLVLGLVLVWVWCIMFT